MQPAVQAHSLQQGSAHDPAVGGLPGPPACAQQAAEGSTGDGKQEEAEDEITTEQEGTEGEGSQAACSTHTHTHLPHPPPPWSP